MTHLHVTITSSYTGERRYFKSTTIKLVAIGKICSFAIFAPYSASNCARTSNYNDTNNEREYRRPQLA